jgi:heat shock protein HslJ
MACCTSACKSSRNSVSKQETVTEQAVTIIEKYWKLIEINGNPVIVGESVSREAFIILKQEGNLVNGNGGCNTLSGTYEIDPAIYRIKFSQMVTTMMACMNMEVETELKKVLEMADSYSLSPDGKYLSLNRARMAPLARFEAVYLK